MISFHFHAKEKMQIAKIFHLEFLRKFFFHLQKFILIVTHQDEIIDVDNNKKFDVSNLRNVHVKVHITLHELDVFQENI
jgi:hypothetical protein